METALNLARNFGLVRLAVIAATLLSLTGGLFYLVAHFSKPEMALLYSDLDLSDAGKIVSKLEGLAIPVELRGGGNQIFVPAGSVARLRMEMAELGLPRGGSMGYEIFDKEEPFGTSGFMQNINHLRALEGELSRTITSLAQVSAARVHLVLPKRELFSREKEEPSASIVLKLSGPGRLAQSRVRSIQHLVAAAVPRLSPERISIVDDQGNLLASSESNPESVSASSLDELRRNYQNRLSQTVIHLIEKYVGMGKVTAEVAVDLDLERVVENAELFNPEGQVIRSTQNIEEGEQSSNSSGKGSSVENQLPNGGGAGDGAAGGDRSSRTEQVTNYEISKTIKNHTKEMGGVKKLAIAVLVDGAYSKDDKGQPLYKARTKEEIEQLTKLVKTAVGFDEKRGDKVEVVNMQFAAVDFTASTENNNLFFGLTRPEIVRIVEVVVLGLIGLLSLLLVFKPLMQKILESTPPEPRRLQEVVSADAMTALPSQGPLPSLPHPNGQAYNQMGGQPMNIPSSNATVQLQNVDGTVNASSYEEVGKIVEEKPEEAVTVLRGWMAETA